MRNDFGPEFGIDGIFLGILDQDKSRKVPFETIGNFQIMKEIWKGGDKVPTMMSTEFIKAAEEDMKNVEAGH